MWAKGGIAEFFGSNAKVKMFSATAAAGAVNWLDFVPASSGNAVRMRALGTDANIDVSIEPKGTGVIRAPLASWLNFVDDAAAAAGGVPLGGLYRQGQQIVVRIS